MTMQFVTGAHEKHHRLLCLIRDEMLLDESNTVTVTEKKLKEYGLSFHDAERVAKVAKRAGHFTYPPASFLFSDTGSFKAIVKHPSAFRELVDDFEHRFARHEKSSSGELYRYNGKKGELNLPPHPVITFTGRVAKLLDFFYNAEDRKEWQTYEDITAKIPEIARKQIKDDVGDINKRVRKHTHEVVKKIIASRKKGNTATSAKEYRWAL